ncbi:hypothetical protein OsI_05886 [Oryza sativa Indica Group]|uniref:non-specific serine/threonine protein kinase n=1 Tax=Oryza sativa subsp. indica TaxID=39946 RepID=B8AHT9_ORYSI|nr:hypothetical protein OsI_05886 [Oryza sativa Indica Group]
MHPLHSPCKKHSNKFPIPVLALALVLLINLASLTSSCTEQDRSSLLRFLRELSQDGGLAASWQDGTDCCKWDGITCSQDSTVTDVSLASRSLQGRISPSLGNLPGLLRLNLSHNLLSGALPKELLSSSSLITIDVSFNRLDGDLDELPSSTPARPLQVLNISSNLLAGQFPSSTWVVMKNMVALNVSNNSFSGHIPANFCTNSPYLSVLELSYNQLSGSIPPGFGSCSRLRVLKAGHNNLSGTIPDEIFNATSLECLSFPNNDFQGTLEWANVVKLSKLATLDLGENNFSGNISESIDVVWNKFNGTIPESIYSCSNLTALRLSFNNFRGQLSEKIGNLKSLSFLSLVKNSLANITSTLQMLQSSKNLTTLIIAINFMHETIPLDDSIDGFENLQVLSLYGCSLSGKIPHWLSKLKNLAVLFLHDNQFTGQIPDWISSLNFLFYLDITSNSLSGEIPTALMEMPMFKTDNVEPRVFELPVFTAPLLQYRRTSALPKVLNLGINNFTGVIPKEIGQLKALLLLNLSSNKFSGGIPESICNITNLQVLDISSNDLTGPIPAALNKLNFLSAFNVSNNDLEGSVPTVGQLSTFPNSSFDGNPKLCGPMLVHHCGSDKTSRCRNDGTEETLSNIKSEQTLVMLSQGKGEQTKLTFTDLKATKNFDKENIIGCGGYGLVYKAELSDGSMVAIKKLNSDMCLMEREFSAEVDALSTAQHDNLVPLWGYCIQGNSMLLIYSYMENGSLDDWLHNRNDDASSFLNWPMRLKIAQGASQGISYIHDVCKPQIVHRDIKCSNVLLDKEFKAHIADFGLSRLILPNRTHVTTELVGTFGYIPPEYGQGWVATLRGDMYSFGVVLLELLTGRRPVPILSSSKQLVEWVQEMISEGKYIEVLDPTLRGTGYEKQMVKVLEVACQCVNHNPGMRPTIQEVSPAWTS